MTETLLGVIFGAECDVMDNARTHATVMGVGNTEQINGPREPIARTGAITKPVALVTDGFETHDFRQEFGRVFVAFFGNGDAVKSVDRLVDRDRAVCPWLSFRFGDFHRADDL